MSIKKDQDRLLIKRMTLHPKPSESFINVSIRQAYILPTIRGCYYIATLIIMFIWSINLDLSLGYFITFSSLIFALIIAVINVQNITKIQVTPIKNLDFFANQFSYFSLEIKTTDQNDKLQIYARRNGLFSKPISLSNNQQKIIQVPLDTNHRGIHYLDYVRLSSHYPIGIFQSWCWLSFQQPLIVYPQPIGDIALPFNQNDHANDDSNLSHQGNEDFVSIREYRPGDSLRQIVWRKTINQTLYAKEFKDHTGKRCSLRLNDPSIQHLNIEQKLSQLCQWVIEASQKNLTYELILPNQTIPANTGVDHQNKCLKALACY